MSYKIGSLAKYLTKDDTVLDVSFQRNIPENSVTIHQLPSPMYQVSPLNVEGSSLTPSTSKTSLILRSSGQEVHIEKESEDDFISLSEEDSDVSSSSDYKPENSSKIKKKRKKHHKHPYVKGVIPTKNYKVNKDTKMYVNLIPTVNGSNIRLVKLGGEQHEALCNATDLVAPAIVWNRSNTSRYIGKFLTPEEKVLISMRSLTRKTKGLVGNALTERGVLRFVQSKSKGRDLADYKIWVHHHVLSVMSEYNHPTNDAHKNEQELKAAANNTA
jgi:hypothetical protein